MLGYISRNSETGCLVPVTTAGPVGGTVEKLEYGCNKNYALPLTENTAGEGYVGISCECPIYYNPATGTLTVESITGNITNAGISECVCVTNTLSNVSYNVALVCGDEIYKSANNNLTFNPGTGVLHSRNICVCSSGTSGTLITPSCIRTTCISVGTGIINNLTSNTVTATCFCGTATCADSAWIISDGTATVRAQCNNELNMYPGSGDTFWINYRGGPTHISIGNGAGNGGLGDVYAANFCGNVAKALQACNTIAAGNTGDLVYSQMAGSDFFRIRVGGANEEGWAEIATADDGNEPIYVRQYQIAGSDYFDHIVHEATLLDGNGNTFFPGRTYAYNGFMADKSDHAANSNVAGFCFASSTSGQGYYGGAYVGHCNVNVNGWWGYATFGFYNAENDTLCRGICVRTDGTMFGVNADCLGFNGSCYIPTAGNISYYLQSNRALRAVTSGCTLSLYDTWS